MSGSLQENWTPVHSSSAFLLSTREPDGPEEPRPAEAEPEPEPQTSGPSEEDTADPGDSGDEDQATENEEEEGQGGGAAYEGEDGGEDYQEASEATVSEDEGGEEEGEEAKSGKTKKPKLNKLPSFDPRGEGKDYSEFLQQQAKELFDRLEAYREKNGDCNVPRDYAEDPTLGAWVHEQRERHRKNTLPQDRQEALTAIGFVWETQSDIQWREKLDRLKAYKEEHGDCVVPGNYAADPGLAMWVKYQRDAMRRGRLSNRQIQMLEELGFQWELALEKQWNDKFDKLKVYQQTYGDCNVPYNFSEDPALGMWVKYQRDAKRRGRLNAKYEDTLEGLGFQWEPAMDKQWQDRYDKLKAFEAEYGHCNVPDTYRDQPLSKWVQQQRSRYKSGKLPASRLKALEKLGFELEPGLEKQWQERLAKLRLYLKEHGDCNVPASWPEDPALGAWVMFQREREKKGRLPPKHKHQLDQVGFRWDPSSRRATETADTEGSGGVLTAVKPEPLTVEGPKRGLDGVPFDDIEASSQGKKAVDYDNFLSTQWFQLLERLAEYKEKVGDCDVPRDYAEDPALGSWIHEQRERKKRGQLPEDKSQKLEELGFQFRSAAEILWDEQFERLEAYKNQYGNCLVPHNFTEDQKLANWVSYQKERIRRGKLEPERLERLKVIGFEWEPLLERQWNEKFERLVAFKAEHSHCSVPGVFPSDPQLGNWVKLQRERMKKGKLPVNNIKRLNEIGFNWGSAADAATKAIKDSTPPRKPSDAASADPSGRAAATAAKVSGGHPSGAVKPKPEKRKMSKPPQGGSIGKKRPLAEDSDTGSEGAGDCKRANADGGKGAPGQNNAIHSMANKLKRAAEVLESYGNQVEEMQAKKLKLSQKVKALRGSNQQAEQQAKKVEDQLASKDDTIKGLKRNLELMTSALDRAENKIDEVSKRAEQVERSKRELEAMLHSRGTESASLNGQGGTGSSGRLGCLRCGERPRSCVVLPCLHLLYCRPCLDAAHSMEKICPGCKTPSISVMDVQLSL